MSLKSLAESMGLSKTTVSRALAGYQDVAPETRERVRLAANKINYRPNPIAQRLTKGATDTVAIVVPSTLQRRYEPLFVDLAASIGSRLAEDEMDLILTSSRPGEPELAVYQRLVDGRRADAVIVVRLRVNDDRVAYLKANKLPFICFGRTDDIAGVAYVDGDGFGGFQAATRHLVSLGHRRFAFLGGPDGTFSSGNRKGGYCSALNESGLSFGPMLEARSDERSGAEMARAALGSKPTALVCATDRIAFGALTAVRDAGLVPGVDVSVIGHDNLPITAYTDPPLSTMELDLADVGIRMAEATLALIAGANPEDHRSIVKVTPIWRASVGPPPA